MNSNGEQVKYINISEVIFDNNEVFDEEKLKNLSDNMFKNGMLEPLEAVKVGDKYKILSQEKFQVVKQNGFTIIPILIGTTEEMVKSEFQPKNKNIDFEIIELPNEPKVEESPKQVIKENNAFTSSYDELNMSPFVSSYSDTINKYIINEFDSNDEIKPQDSFITNIESQIVNDYSVSNQVKSNNDNLSQSIDNHDYSRIKSYLTLEASNKVRFEENETPNEYQIKIYITK